MKHRENALQNLYEYVRSNINKVSIPFEYLSLCALAGRVCYSGYPDLLDDKRLNEPETIVSYLNKLSKWTHYSVFAHLPVEIKEVTVEDFIKYELYNLFKSYYDKDNKILKLNLRHVLEAYNTVDRGKLVEVVKDLNLKVKAIKSMKYLFRYESNGFFNEDLWEIEVFHIFLDDYNWRFFLLVDIDRATTHQMVRHQTLNFNQQSHRYVRLTDVRIPRTVRIQLNPTIFEEVYDFYNLAYKKYHDLIENYKTKPEVARLILPQGSTTNIVISGYDGDIQKFIGDRMDSSAQQGIRKVAEDMYEAIKRSEETR